MIPLANRCISLVLTIGYSVLALPVVAQNYTLTDLQTAIQQGDHKKLETVLKHRVSPNQHLPDGSLPLSWAVEQQDAEAVRLLLKHRAKVDDPDTQSNPFRPLVVGCLYPNSSVLDQLLSTRPNVNVRGPEGIPVLSLCAAHATPIVLKRMITNGAEVKVADDNGQTPLMWAAAHGRPENFKLLVEAGADINIRSRGGFTPLMFAVKSGSANMAALAVNLGADANVQAADGTTLVQLAMYQGNYGFADQLIDRDTDLEAFDRNGRTLLHAAVVANQPALVEHLLKEGADINALTGPSKVLWRYESNFRAGDYEFPLLPPLLLAAQKGHSELMALLADHGADTEHRSAEGNNVVLAAAASSQPLALEVALGLSNNPNVTNNRGNTPLHRVLAQENEKTRELMLKTLARHGARIDIENKNGKTAAEIADDKHFKSRPAFSNLFIAKADPQRLKR